ncbi:TraR/DksA family transcriptional regulator [Treponema socranskii]|uniref:RNA polymerase-binding protein DksA n=1 Tax=Treponema socranskii subsp. socranskii VPI DR56BR1116 = ATCC 35536 TaxID=1125725 RepID=U2LL56_TRESO|nr:TraR/DksA family transcriptional regulator [Treponema socranskii]ERF61730.1 putative RNA polymerase-binding protein DksA [Treponema socranskii subsp. socranskii VPI DR56BR1116 = ATCC 35536]ERK05148.1 putative RNA polymerase-binding protein DksA [Treponema socranskii subsp. socranskii VPI DR56BR1116 = ATCC 35536]MDR9860074.1 TraR/DksA family transcriptional regulator [Treponema socranskii]
MDKKFIESMKNDLLARRQTILASLAEQSDDMKKLVKTVAAGDVIDVASDAIDRTLLDSLGSQDAARLQLVDNALDRIRQGKYGKCVKCGKDIPQQRLKALPYALMCVTCASEEERKRR